MVCMELVEIKPQGNTLTPSNNKDREHLDPLVKRINDDKKFTAEDFRNNGKAGTLVGDRGGPRDQPNYWRIDSQIASTERANLNYQVGDFSKAKCLIRYLTEEPIPAGFPANTRLTQHFQDKHIKAKVQDGLDIGVLRAGPRETEIQWRVIHVPVVKVKNSYKLSKEAVRTALRREYRKYSNDIMKEEFEDIRHGKEKIQITPPFEDGIYVEP